ncbi:MAG TPA: GGDEF domain-containing protein [Vicinamibacterales bacterium]|nr:GGDEF domain-containing protein [Vicinamibacterales bacterium]
MLAVEAAVMAMIVLGLFRVRTVLGLTPLYIVLGGLQYLEATLSLRVEVLPSVWIYPASTVMFTATLAAVLLIYVKEDAIEARKLVYGLVLANVTAAIMSLLIGLHLGLEGAFSPSLGIQDFMTGAWITTVGTSLLFIDVLGIILVYEFIARYVRGLFGPFFLALLAVASFDSVIFTQMVHGGRPNLVALQIASLLGKATMALFYSLHVAIYLRFMEPRTAVVGTGDVGDVFQRLTYRQKYEQVRQRMSRDALTGLFNRGHFDEVLPGALAAAKRHATPLSLAIIDVDKFKEINDGLSHLEGDRALQLIGRTLAEQSRASDVPCRYGGDEFVVLLTNANAAEAQEFAERFRDMLTYNCSAASPPYPWGLLSTTIGVSTYPSDAIVTPEDLMRVADRRLYDGKHGGRDRIVAAGA